MYEVDGLEFSGLGETFPVSRTPSTGLASLQRDLQRLGLLAAGTGSDGADGKWGLHTATALTQAGRMIGWSGQPFTMQSSGHQVSIPDELITRLHAMPPSAQIIQQGATLPTTAPPTTTPTVTPYTPSPEATILPVPPGDSSAWMPYALAGGAVLVVGGLAYWMMSPKRAVAANRRHRVRRNRRHRRRR